jgi:hypothetical protein
MDTLDVMELMERKLASALFSSQTHAEQSERNLRRAIFAENKAKALDAQMAHDAAVAASEIQQLKNNLAAADDLLAAYRAARKAGE